MGYFIIKTLVVAAVAAALPMALAIARIDPPAPYAGTVYGTSYGMRCDGATDDTAAFQAAINAAYNQILQLPGGQNGSCVLRLGQITITAAIAIRGQSKGNQIGPSPSFGTWLEFASGSGDGISIQTRDPVELSGFALDVDNPQTSGACIALTGAAGGGVNNYNFGSVFEHLNINSLTGTGCWDDFRIDEAGGFTIRDVFSMSAIHDDVLVINSLNPDLGEHVITGNEFWDNNQHAGTEANNPFATTNTSPTVTVTRTGHGLVTGQTVTYAPVAAFNNVTISGPYTITVTDANHFTITAGTNANATGSGGGAAVHYRNSQNALIEYRSSLDTAITGNKLNGGAYGILVAAAYGPTGSMRIAGNSIENNSYQSIALTQTTSGVQVSNFMVTGNEFSTLDSASAGQSLYIGTGTPGTAPNWLHSVTVTGNVVNNAVTAANGLIQINDGNGVVVADNVLGNGNFARTPGISVGSGAANVALLNNTAYLLPAGLIGTLAPAALAPQTPAPNMLVNPGIDIDQANEGASVAVSNSGTLSNCADEWQAQFTTAASGITCQRVADAPPGTAYSVKLTIGTGSATVNAGDFGRIQQKIEQTNFITDDLAFGTSAAKTLSLGLWLKSSVTGTFSVALVSGLNTASFIEPCTISLANTWTYCAYVIPGDTGDSWTGFNGIGLRLYVTVEAGSTFASATTGAWVAGQVFGTPSQTVLTQTTGATIQVSQAKLEMSRAPTAYVSRPLQQELALAERYYAKTFPQGTAPAQNAGKAGALCTVAASTTAGSFAAPWRFPVEMRAAPAIATYNPSAANANWRNVTGAADATVLADPPGALGTTGLLIGEQTTAPVVGNAYCIHATADARL